VWGWRSTDVKSAARWVLLAAGAGVLTGQALTPALAEMCGWDAWLAPLVCVPAALTVGWSCGVAIQHRN